MRIGATFHYKGYAEPSYMVRCVNIVTDSNDEDKKKRKTRVFYFESIDRDPTISFAQTERAWSNTIKFGTFIQQDTHDRNDDNTSND